MMDLDINAFNESVKHLYAYGVPVSVKRVDKNRLLVFVDDKPALLDAEELVNTVDLIMDKRGAENG